MMRFDVRVPAWLAATASTLLLVACTGNDAAVKRIGHLTQAQLAHAFCTVDALPDDSRLQDAQMPAEFGALGATRLRRRGHVASLRVSGAVDDLVWLEFINVGRADAKNDPVDPGRGEDRPDVVGSASGFHLRVDHQCVRGQALRRSAKSGDVHDQACEFIVRSADGRVGGDVHPATIAQRGFEHVPAVGDAFAGRLLQRHLELGAAHQHALRMVGPTHEQHLDQSGEGPAMSIVCHGALSHMVRPSP